ncbi:MAG: PHP domain-containing protein [Candidatus Falkowbacteria bacterium]
MLIDLQLHSINSDGYLTPLEIAKQCKQRNLKVASLTDHHTVSGQEEFKRACQQFKIKAIPGMELYVKLGNRHLNMLWYNFDVDNPELHKLLRDSQNRRRVATRKALEKLTQQRYVLDINSILDSHNHYIPINRAIDSFYALNKKRIQQELSRKNIIETEIIRHYFRNSQKTRMHESYISIERVIKLKKKIGGQLILAHPCKFIWIQEKIIRKLRIMGLDGLEVLSPHHSWEAVSYLQAIASQYKLIMTGGSDFHRFEKADWYKIKSSWSYFEIESKLLNRISEII